MTFAAPAQFEPRRLAGQPAVVATAGAAVVLGALWLGAEHWRFAALFLIGALLGVALYHGAFGFTSAYRRAIAERDVSGILAQLVMLGLAMLLFAPLLARGQVFGHDLGGAVAPAGLQVAIGSFLFGIGMQLGGSCASGTLYTVGGGSARMVVTLTFFVAGSFLGSLDLGRWAGLPSLGPVSLAWEFGYTGALALQLGLLAVLWVAARRFAGAAPQRPLWGGLSWRRLLAGPWPLLLSGAVLALANALTLLVAGHPWSVTWGLTVWGAEAATVFGWDPATSGFWASDWARGVLERGVFADHISIMNFGTIAGALIAAGLAGRFAPSLKIPLASLAAAVIGGLLMGYGARLAFGCNIGAFFSGIASFSLHGWIWIVCALAGTWLGMRLRPLFGLRN